MNFNDYVVLAGQFIGVLLVIVLSYYLIKILRFAFKALLALLAIGCGIGFLSGAFSGYFEQVCGSGEIILLGLFLLGIGVLGLLNFIRNSHSDKESGRGSYELSPADAEAWGKAINEQKEREERYDEDKRWNDYLYGNGPKPD